MAPANASEVLSIKAFGLSFTHVLPLVLVFFILVALKRRYLSPIRDIPGPFLASFSGLWQILHIIKGHTELAVLDLHKQHGTFVRVSHKEISISHPDAVNQLLIARLHKGEFYQAFALPDQNFKNLMSELDPKEHMRKTKNVASGFTLSNIVKAEAFIDATIQQLQAQLDRLAQAGEKVHFDRWFNYCAFDIVGEVTFSGRFGFVEQGRDVGAAIANSRKLALYVCLISHAYWLHGVLLGNPIFGWLNLQPTSHIFDTCLAAVDVRKKNDSVRRDMMEQWLEMRRTYPDRMEEKEILAAAVSNIGAGADTISTMLQTLVYYLLRHPKHLSRLQEEIDSAQTRGELSPTVSYAESQKLSFLQACIKESYRIHSAVSFGYPRVAGQEGVTIAGRFFPQGTVLSVNPWVIHRDRSIFGEDADSFNPERWLDPQRAKSMDKYLIHWGAGYNKCPGRHLAHLEISKISATLLRDYNIKQVDPKQDWSYTSWFVALPENWPCYISRRNPSQE